MTDDPIRAALSCVGCERPAPKRAKPDPMGYWICQDCEDGMRWAMAWQAAIMGAARDA